ncbi:MAG TPA: glycosyltransferase family 4 protein [Candidatus Nanoarchaeia archaeon]|nr:glycosyltransferase family 4 protein [Candidatus Nanoarchaeia archaeon]
MKIAQIVCVYPPDRGGIGTSARETARVLSSAGHDVITFVLQSKNSPLSRGVARAARDGACSNREEMTKVIYPKAFPKLGNGGLMPQLFWRLRDFDLAYLHYPFFGAAEIIWFLKKFIWKNKVKLIIHFHMEPEFSSPLLKFLSWPSRLIAPSLFRQADLIVCASRDYAEASMPPLILAALTSQSRGGDCDGTKIKEIPFSVDTEKFQPAKSNDDTSPYFGATSPEEKIFRILFVGGLDKAHYFKGVNILLEALAKIKNSPLDLPAGRQGVGAEPGEAGCVMVDSAKIGEQKIKDWQLEIVGDGDLRADYENRARELGIAEKIIFSVRVSDEDLPKKYQAADCLILPSVNRGEAFGIVLLEAMASGLPVIASNLPGVRKVFTAGAEGLLSRPGNVYDLKEKIEFLMNNPARCAEMGKAARRLAEEKYSQEKISQRLVEEIEKM